MEISIATKTFSGALVACILGFAYLSFSYFPVNQGIAYLFIGFTVLMTLVLLYYINAVMNKNRKSEGYTPYNPKIEGYNPKPYVPQSQLSQQYPSYRLQDQLISDQTIGDNSSNNSQYVIKDSKVTIINSDKENKANETSSE